VETGVIRRLPDGEYIEVHAPPNPAIEAHVRDKKPVPIIAGADGDDPDGVPSKGMRHPLGRLRAKMSRAYGGEKVALTDGHGEDQEKHAAVGPGEDDTSSPAR
jgi:ubiquinol-cytochrome c reductase cytochrome b subunit